MNKSRSRGQIPWDFIIAGLALFSGAALFGDKGTLGSLPFAGTLAVAYGVYTIVRRSRRRLQERHRGNHGGTSSPRNDEYPRARVG